MGHGVCRRNVVAAQTERRRHERGLRQRIHCDNSTELVNMLGRR